MHEELVSFETAVLARRKGFDEVCRNVFYADTQPPRAIGEPTINQLVTRAFEIVEAGNRDRETIEAMKIEIESHKTQNSKLPLYIYGRPTQDLIERWLREKHRIISGQAPILKENLISGYLAVAFALDNVDPKTPLYQTRYETFEMAREVAIQKALNLLPDA